MKKTEKKELTAGEKARQEEESAAQVAKAEADLYNAAYSYAKVLGPHCPRDIWSEEAKDIYNAALSDAVNRRPRAVPQGNYNIFFKFH